MTEQTVEDLSKINAKLTEQIDAFTKEIARLNEQVAYLIRKLYGKSSEKNLNDGQLSLFNEEEASDEDDNLPSKS